MSAEEGAADAKAEATKDDSPPLKTKADEAVGVEKAEVLLLGVSWDPPASGAAVTKWFGILVASAARRWWRGPG